MIHDLSTYKLSHVCKYKRKSKRDVYIDFKEMYSLTFHTGCVSS